MNERETPAPAPSGPPPATWRAFEGVPVFAAALIVTTIVGGAALALGIGEETATVVASGAFELALAGGVLGLIRWFHRPAMPALGPPVHPWRELLQGIGGGLLTRVVAVFGIGPVVVLLVEALTDARPRVPDQVPTALEVAPTLLLAFVVVVLAPLGEELFFRGLLFRSLRRTHGFWTAAVPSAAAFGVVHYVDGSWFYVPIMFVVGLCFAYVYERSGRILTAIAAHATFNLIGILFILLG